MQVQRINTPVLRDLEQAKIETRNTDSAGATATRSEANGTIRLPLSQLHQQALRQQNIADALRVTKSVDSRFRDQFSELASDRNAFHPVMREVYGDSIDYDKVKIHSGSIKQGLTDLFGMRAHVVGNDIYLPEGNNFNTDSTLTEEGLELLSHEMGHVWQFQNDGAGYISGALGAQIIDGNNAYDWGSAVADGVNFNDMNPEQQAELAMDIGIAIDNDNDGLLTANAIFNRLGGVPTDAEFAIIQDAHQRLLNGDV